MRSKQQALKIILSMKQTVLSRFHVALILGGAAVMLSLAMGMRQSFGLLQPHMIRDIGITAADFSLAIAIQNIVWGATQPFMGILADRHGARPVALLGVTIYALGLAFALTASSAWGVTLGMGLCVGLALSCTASNIAMSVTAKAVSPLKRSMAMGSVSALGSLGLTLASPMAQHLISTAGWQSAVIGFLGLAAVIAPSYSGLFFRNAFNLGLLLLTCPEADSLQENEQVQLTYEGARPQVVTSTGRVLACAPVPSFLMDMVNAGGLVNVLKQRMAAKSSQPSQASLSV